MSTDPIVQSPLDSDQEPAPRHGRPSLRHASLVFAGGTIGAGARAGVTLWTPEAAALTTVVAINVAGAFALGVLLERLSMRGPDVGRPRDVRMLLGTGVLGGFTTYSAIAVDAAQLAAVGPLSLILFALGQTVLGVAAAWLGIRLAGRRAA
ncbi:fluoride efflux transporter FluC [Agrococcus sp. SGAir0287]|uniref:fluoride efflux transporter FluC n=1 Tax=Agrococcus sp. SGAir0287 TaxID=2070347 RepID=UPI0010CD4194|nr:CrcB family protein [Agrococcus sp. SGAir0287]QCR19187.1 hypothetical protein C1N71_06865 [Agrococcus sp. SGAir0287]